jgi:hypothetical protein
MRLSGATESAVNHSKQMKRGVYEQGRKISKPPAIAPCCPMLGSFCHGSKNGLKNRRIFGCTIAAEQGSFAPK